MVNLSPINEWETNPNSSVANTWAPSDFDYTVTHNGNLSIRSDGSVSPTLGWLNREVNSKWLSVKNGDTMRFGGWIKTSPYEIEPEDPYRGARFGIDFYGSIGFLDGISWDCYGSLPVIAGGSIVVSQVDNVANWVPMGSDWTYKKIDFVVPYQLKGQNVYGVKLWFQPWLGYRGGSIIPDTTPCWMSEPNFYVMNQTIPSVPSASYFGSIPADNILPYTGVGADYLWFSDADPSIWTQWTFTRAYNGFVHVFNGHIDLVDFWKPLFHTPQISVCFRSASQRQASWYDKARFETVLSMFAERDTPIIVAHYPAWNAVAHCGSDALKADWLQFVSDFKGDSRISAVKLYGEPVGAIDNGQGTDTVSWVPDMSVRDMARWFVQLVKDIHSIDPDRVVIYPFMGLSYYNPQDLFDDIEDTGIFSEPNVIFDIVHPYWFEWKYEGPAMTPSNKPYWYEVKDIIPWVNKVGSKKCWCGETFMFTHEANEITGYPPVLENQKAFLLNMVNVFVKHKMAFNIWGLLTLPLDYQPPNALYIPTNEHCNVFKSSDYGKVSVIDGGENMSKIKISGTVVESGVAVPVEGADGVIVVSEDGALKTLNVVTDVDGKFSAEYETVFVGELKIDVQFTKDGYNDAVASTSITLNAKDMVVTIVAEIIG